MNPIPQIIVTYLLVDRLVFRISHKLAGTYNQFEHYYSLPFYLKGAFFTHAMFYLGGFYNRIELPQIAILTLTVFQLVINIIRNREKKQDSFDILTSIFNFSLILLLLYWGHFYDQLNFDFLNYFTYAEEHNLDLYYYQRRL
jgi:fucose 4-O-acetylase-like acetyltransferase